MLTNLSAPAAHDRHFRAMSRDHVSIARRFLTDKVSDPTWVSQNLIDGMQANVPRAVYELTHLIRDEDAQVRDEDAQALRDWCVRWLTLTGWALLQDYLQQRVIDSTSREVTISVDQAVLERLTAYAAPRGLSTSDAIAQLLNRASGGTNGRPT